VDEQAKKKKRNDERNGPVAQKAKAEGKRKRNEARTCSPKSKDKYKKL
jgi:hypothetical protein